MAAAFAASLLVMAEATAFVAATALGRLPVESGLLSGAGQWSSRVELDEPGGHAVEVRSTEPPAVLARYRVLVER